MISKLFFLMILVFSTNISFTQKKQAFDFYTSVDLNAGNYYGYDLAINTLLAKKLNIKVGVSRNVRVPKTIPEDFGLFYEGIGIIVPNYNPKEFQNSYEVLVGGVINFKENRWVRISINAGLGMVRLKVPTNWKKLQFPPKLGHQYTFNYTSFRSIHIIFNPRVDFPFTNFYGLSFSPILKIGKDSHFFGIGIGQMIGKIR